MKESKNKITLNLFTVIFNGKDTLYSSGQAQQIDSILALYQMNINLNLFPFSFSFVPCFEKFIKCENEFYQKRRRNNSLTLCQYISV